MDFGHCNTGKMTTNKKGWLGSIGYWTNKEGIVNIFSIPNITDMGFHFTYNIWDGHYIMYTKDGAIQFNKYEMGLPYIDSKKPKDVDFVKTVWEIFEGLT